MNYKLIYNSLIKKAQNRQYIEIYEIHHIVPRCMGGDDNSDNLVKLSHREHFVAHLLLAHVYNNLKVWAAVICMKGSHNSYMNSRLYEIARKKRSELMRGNSYAKNCIIPEKTRKAIAESNKKRGFTQNMKEKCTFAGKSHSEEHKEYMRQKMTGRIFSEETKLKMSIAQKKRFGKNV